MELLEKKCISCKGKREPLTKEQINDLLPKVNEWKVVDGKLNKTWKFKDFAEAGVWLEKVKALAEAENHHPDIHWYYNKITLELFTHSIKGLSEDDFILAAKINEL